MPYWLKYTDNLPDWMNGRTIGPFISIRPKFEGDEPLLIHEKTHVAQFWKFGALCCLALLIGAVAADLSFFWWGFSIIGLAAHPVLYALWPGFRYEMELEAYSAQVHAGADLDAMAELLASPKYGYAVTAQTALEDLLLS